MEETRLEEERMEEGRRDGDNIRTPDTEENHVDISL